MRQLYEACNGWSYHLLLFWSFWEKKEVARNIGWKWLNNTFNILFNLKPFFMPSLNFLTSNLQYAKMNSRTASHCMQNILLCVFCGFSLVLFLFFLYVQMAKNIKASFSIVRCVFFFAERCKLGSSPYSLIYECVRSHFSIFAQPIFTSAVLDMSHIAGLAGRVGLIYILILWNDVHDPLKIMRYILFSRTGQRVHVCWEWLLDSSKAVFIDFPTLILYSVALSFNPSCG